MSSISTYQTEDGGLGIIYDTAFVDDEDYRALDRWAEHRAIGFGEVIREALSRGGWTVSEQNGKWRHNWKFSKKYPYGLTTEELYKEWRQAPMSI